MLRRRRAAGIMLVFLVLLIGAIVGSGLFIFVGGPLVRQWLVDRRR